MKKMITYLITTILIISCMTITLSNNVKADLGNIFVDDDADQSWYDATHVKTIQEGIDNASVNDIIFVHDGTYIENVVVNKSVNLIGENKDNTIINGNGSATIEITVDEVEINSFTIRNIYQNCYSNNYFGVRISAKNITLTNNNIRNNSFGIELFNEEGDINFGEYNINISNNIVSYNCHGIYLDGSNHSINNNSIVDNFRGLVLTGTNNTITNNSFTNCGLRTTSSNNTVIDNAVNEKPLIYLEGEKDKIISSDAGQILLISCENITIRNKILSNTDHAIILAYSNNCTIENNDIINHSCAGIFSLHSNNNTIKNNTVISSDYWSPYGSTGIYLVSSSNNIVSNNNISYQIIGIQILSMSSSNIISNNTISNNANTGIIIYSAWSQSTHNMIYHNTFVNNTKNAAIDPNNIWYNPTLKEGNYWDDYNGKDMNRDGIGDMPYNEDLYPLGFFYLTADFNISNENPTTNDEVIFTDCSFDPEDNITSWYWDFGDGDTSTEQNPTHNFESEGTYEVILKVFDNEGNNNIIQKTINVENPTKLIISLNRVSFGRVNAVITNDGINNLENINWIITAKGGLLNKINVSNSGNIAILNSQNSKKITSWSLGKDKLKGFGRVNVTVTIIFGEETFTENFNGFVFGRLFLK